jgi:hypothetical protein
MVLQRLILYAIKKSRISGRALICPPRQQAHVDSGVHGYVESTLQYKTESPRRYRHVLEST